MSTNLYADVTTSFTKLVQALIEDLTSQDFPLQYLTLEGYSEEKDLPAGDHIGFSGVELEVSDHIVTGKAMLGVIVENDENLFRLRKHVGQVFQRVLPESTIAVYNAETGEIRGQIVVTNGSSIMPIGGKTGQPYQLVAFNWVTTLRYSPYEELGL